ncbi:hypothetical protein GCM10028774_03520 [Spirosoma jeollabukense]
MLHFLGGSDDSRVGYGSLLQLRKQVLGFFNESLHSHTGFTIGVDAQLPGNLLQSLRMLLGLLPVQLKSLA